MNVSYNRNGADLGVEHFFLFQIFLFRALQYRIQPSKYCHGKDDVTILSTYIEVAEDVVCDSPDIVCDPAEVGVVHFIWP